MKDRPFLLSTLVDFPDDCQRIEWTEDLVAQLIDRLHWMGVRRVYWNYYHAGHWEWFSCIPTAWRRRQNARKPGRSDAGGTASGPREGHGVFCRHQTL